MLCHVMFFSFCRVRYHSAAVSKRDATNGGRNGALDFNGSAARW